MTERSRVTDGAFAPWEQAGPTTVISAPVTSTEAVQAQADALYWFHAIDLGNGVMTKGVGIPWPHSVEILPAVSYTHLTLPTIYSV